ncbi:MAG: hypothetical protein QOE89_2927 [Pseudonocardiales bacterium]|jgi:hypothetical protein|nr:hypothetical protein [Pseudonocardiales bacterium]
MTNGRFADGLGSGSEPAPLGEEVAKLLTAAQDWFHRNLGEPSTSKIATGAPECAWCPLCQLISALRGDQPELTERFVEAQSAVSGLLHALADAVSSAGSTGRRPSGGPPVQKIDLGSADESD